MNAYTLSPDLLHKMDAYWRAANYLWVCQTVLNDLDRLHLAGDVIDRAPSLDSLAAYAKQHLCDKLLDHKTYFEIHGEDMPEIRDWKWKG